MKSKMCGVVEQIVFQELRMDYLRAKPPTQIKLLREFFGPNSINPTELLKVTVEDSRNPPPIQYRIAFTKYVIKQLEGRKNGKKDVEGEDSDEEDENISLWYNALESLSSSSAHSEPFYRLYDIFGEEKNIIKVFENESAFVVEGTTGLVTWEASTELAKWLLSSKHAIESSGVKWCVELGCGCGFFAVAAMKIMPNLDRYVVTDGHHSALAKCTENILTNYDDIPSNLDLEIIDWVTDEKKFEEIVENLSLNHDGAALLFGADVVFDPALLPALTNIMILFLESQTKNDRHGKIILSCTVRNETTVDLLREEIGNSINSSELIPFFLFHSYINNNTNNIAYLFAFLNAILMRYSLNVAKYSSVIVENIHSWENGVILQISSHISS